MKKRGQFIGAFLLVFLPAVAMAQTEPAGAKTGKRTKEFLAAFNAGDAKALAEFWTTEGSVIDQAGHETKGRAAIAKHFADAFAKQKGSKINITVTSTRLITPDVAVEEGVTEMTVDGMLPNVAQFSAILVKKDGNWYFDTVRMAPAEAPSHAKYFEDIDWLLGSWSGTTAKGETVAATFESAENGNFIVSTHSISMKDVPLLGTTQWIGWDPVDKQIRSWSFHSKGGFGESTWTKSGERWNIASKSKTAEGKAVTLTNVLTKIDDDNWSWQVTKLTVDGKSMPDGPLVKMKRSNGKVSSDKK